MIYVCYGTRPEIIKLFPVIRELRLRGMPHKCIFTGQHLDLYNDVKHLIPPPDLVLHHDSKDGSLVHSYSSIFDSFQRTVRAEIPRVVLVQGDTTTACAVALSAFYLGIPVAHLEAGLRSDDLSNPFPEEGNRRIITQVASSNFAPTEVSYRRLLEERARGVHLTGNTIVDALEYYRITPSKDSLVVVTIHRRENHPYIDTIFKDIDECARQCPDLTFLFPMHPNPVVQRWRHLLKAPNIKVITPLGYPQMLSLLSRCAFIISDSGGLQEEAVHFGKKIIIVRKITERPETLKCGLGRLADIYPSKYIAWARTEDVSKPTVNPFGDGRSAERVVTLLEKYVS